MSQSNSLYSCLNCRRSENEIPLVNLRYSGQMAWICSQCLPTLIHQPHQLAGRLANAENLAGAPHHEH